VGRFGPESAAPVYFESAAWGVPYSTERCGVVSNSEFGLGSDLNGDGDLGDVVPMVLDPVTGRARSLGADALMITPDYQERRSEFMLFLMDERGDHKDHNGDGDTHDRVLASACVPGLAAGIRHH
jgi:hypothetical protein